MREKLEADFWLFLLYAAGWALTRWDFIRCNKYNATLPKEEQHPGEKTRFKEPIFGCFWIFFNCVAGVGLAVWITVWSFRHL